MMRGCLLAASLHFVLFFVSVLSLYMKILWGNSDGNRKYFVSLQRKYSFFLR